MEYLKDCNSCLPIVLINIILIRKTVFDSIPIIYSKIAFIFRMDKHLNCMLSKLISKNI